jgi:hypothetical protein
MVARLAAGAIRAIAESARGKSSLQLRKTRSA